MINIVYWSRSRESGLVIKLSTCIGTLSDQVKHQLVHMKSGKVFVKLVTMATLAASSEVQYNSAGILGQLSLIGKNPSSVLKNILD